MKKTQMVHGICFILLILTVGCSAPVTKLHRQADSAGLTTEFLVVNDQTLVSFVSPLLTPSHTYVFLEGDGQPWRHNKPSANPNTRRSVVLPLLQATPGGGIYLARPCYGVQELPTTCTPDTWTTNRYSQATVNAMSAALNQLKQTHQLQHYVLVGHSGGGTLAMALAQQRDDVIAVITLAGNLDHQAWTNHFGYLPLTGSINPAKQAPLAQAIIRWHFIGEKDLVIPPALSQLAAQQDPRAKLFTLPAADHTCCWLDHWPDILQSLENTLAEQLPAEHSSKKHKP